MTFLLNLTFGRSLILFASRRSSSRLRGYRRISSGIVDNRQCRLSTYSIWRLHPLKSGMHLNIVILTIAQTVFTSQTKLSGHNKVHFLQGIMETNHIWKARWIIHPYCQLSCSRTTRTIRVATRKTTRVRVARQRDFLDGPVVTSYHKSTRHQWILWIMIHIAQNFV